MVVYMRVCVYDRSFLFWVESNLMWISEFWHRHFFFYSTWILLVSCFLFIHVTVMTLGLIWSGNWISGVAFRWNTLGVNGKLIFHCLGLGVSLLRVVFVMVDLFFFVPVRFIKQMAMLFSIQNTEMKLMLNLNVNFNIVSQTAQDDDVRLVFCEYESATERTAAWGWLDWITALGSRHFLKLDATK